MGDIILCYMKGLNDVREQMDKSIRNIEKAKNDIKKDVAELDAMWEGPAHDIYKKEWQDELAQVEEMLTCLKSISKFEDIAYTDYSKATNKAQALVDSVK